MSKSVNMDEKGRVVIPKNVRDAARINTPAKLLAIARDKGRIELVIVDTSMKRAKSIATRKFAGWKEEEHEADRLATKLLRRQSV
jgi:bifunctional DNA-binding transcriptional regulator/antitoxin component of YhaV-PrlF toxin-antitoxin module